MDETGRREIEWQGSDRLDAAGARRLVELLATGLERLLLAQGAIPHPNPTVVDFGRDLCVYTDHGSPVGADDA
jgi:hypothetical protein